MIDKTICVYANIRICSHICEINSHPVISWKHCASLPGYPVGSCFPVRSSQLRGKRTAVDVQSTRGSKLMGAMDPMVIPCCTVVVRIKNNSDYGSSPWLFHSKTPLDSLFPRFFPLKHSNISQIVPTKRLAVDLHHVISPWNPIKPYETTIFGAEDGALKVLDQ